MRSICLWVVLAVVIGEGGLAQEGGQRPREDSGGLSPPYGGSPKGGEAVSGGSPAYREQSIYVPYTKLRQIFEKEGRGVFVPYEEFQRLWRAAREGAKQPTAAKTPVAAIIAQIESQARVSADVMTVEAKLQIDVVREGWHYVFLRLKDAVVHAATIGGRPARLIAEADKGYWVLIDKQGPEPEKVELLLEYSKAITKQPGTNSVDFEAPQAAVNRWEIRVPEADAKIRVEPNVTVSESGRQEPAAASGGEKQTAVQALVGVTDRVRIAWTAKAEGAAGLAALVTVESRQEITVDEGVIHARTMLTYDIQRADVTQLTLEVPADYNIVNVFDPNIQRWEKQSEGPVQSITATLFQPTRGKQNVLIELEKFAGDKEMPQAMTQAEIRAPVVRAVQAGSGEQLTNIGRQQGVVVARLGSALRGEATSHTGLVQIDTAELPGTLAKQNWQFAYRYAALPFDLVLSVEKLQPQIEAEQLVEVYIEPEQITADLTAVWQIERAEVFQLELEVPEGYAVRRVVGRELAGTRELKEVMAAAVESHHLEDVTVVPDAAQPEVKVTRRTKLVVALSRRAIGKIGLRVELVRKNEEPSLLQPTGNAVALTMPLPRVALTSAQQSRGAVVVYAPESLRIIPAETSGLAVVSPAEAVQRIGSAREGRFAGLREAAAYSFAHEVAALALGVERRRPYVEARELLTVHVESGLVRYEATLFYEIKYSGVSMLAVELPAAIEGEIRNLTPAIREQRGSEQPAGKTGRVLWELRGESELVGQVTVKFGWQRKLGELPVGAEVPIELPLIRPIGADRFWGQIVASKAENIEISVRGEPTGLRPIDPEQDLMAGATVANAARAFEFHEEWSLALGATRYQLEEVKRTSIDRALVRMVATRSGQVTVQALYRLRSARQRVAVVIPDVDPNDAGGILDARPLKINEQAVALEHDGTQFFIPLVGQATDSPVLVELRYTIPATAGRLRVPEFPEDPAIQQVYLAVYLPEETRVLAVDGPWTDEQPGPIRGWPLGVIGEDEEERKAAPDDTELLSRMREGIAHSAAAGTDFPVDGRRRLFSTLRPERGAGGALELTTIHESTLNAVVFVVVAIVGVVLTAWPLATRLWWLAGLLVGVVLLAVFAPELAAGVLRLPLVLAIGLVVVVWLVRAVTSLLPAGALSARLVTASGSSPFAPAADGGSSHE